MEDTFLTHNFVSYVENFDTTKIQEKCLKKKSLLVIGASLMIVVFPKI